MRKLVIPRLAATRDAERAVDHYVGKGAPEAAAGFVTALQEAYDHIGAHPASGSPRYAYELDLPGLRSWPLGLYPYVVFYREGQDHVDVWRVLHAARDLPAWLTE
jgi:toxin ParE1/3/4